MPEKMVIAFFLFLLVLVVSGCTPSKFTMTMRLGPIPDGVANVSINGVPAKEGDILRLGDNVTIMWK